MQPKEVLLATASIDGALRFVKKLQVESYDTAGIHDIHFGTDRWPESPPLYNVGVNM